MEEIPGQTFNANCVLLYKDLLIKAGNLDEKYTHSLGDYDYGFRLYKLGINLISSSEYVVVCNMNHTMNTWKNKKLPSHKRLQLKETPKGSPFREWFYFLNNNFSLAHAAVYSFIPYIKIMLKK